MCQWIFASPLIHFHLKLHKGLGEKKKKKLQNNLIGLSTGRIHVVTWIVTARQMGMFMLTSERQSCVALIEAFQMIQF